MTASTRIRLAGHHSHGDSGHGRKAAEPVFLDRTGRRRRLVAAVSAAATLLLVLIVVALFAGLTGVGPDSMPGWPASDRQPQRVQPTPRQPEPAPSAATESPATSRSPASRAPRATHAGRPSS